MQLVDATVWGFRRFGGDVPHKLLIDGKLTCLIGTNEAGKSSLLSVIADAHQDGAVPELHRSRGDGVPDDQQIVRLRYRLGPEDLDRIRDLYPEDLELPHWFIVSKTAGGRLEYGPDRLSRRSRQPRNRAIDALRASRRYQSTTADIANGVDDEAALDELRQFVARIDALTDALHDAAGTVSQGVLAEAAAMATEIGDEELDVAEALNALAVSEAEEHPSESAKQRLWDACPDFVFFNEEERALSSEYELVDVGDDPPPALRNLARLASLNLPRLRALIQANETGTVRHELNLANERLAEAFSGWSQRPPVHVTFDFSETRLLVHVASGSDLPMRFDERSDGLRQYVALVAATAQTPTHGPPVLLIDEVETHLHYDAQVDLIRVLAEQDAVGQVVYSTHSAACLPDDLGSVRVIQANPTLTRSTIRQHFWADEPGLGPLLMGMGAATLAFIPRRPAVVGEGPSEVLLLPTLLREATGIGDLGYQVAPGLANVRPGRVIGLESHGAVTAWIVDGDKGGAANRKKLISDGICEEAIISLGGLGSGLTLEALIDPTALSDAVAAYAKDIGVTLEIPPEALDVPDPYGAVESAAAQVKVSPPSKVLLANRLLSMRSERQLVNVARIDLAKQLHETFSGLLFSDP